MEVEKLKELDRKEQERVSKLVKKHINDEKIDINIFYKNLKLDNPHTSYNPTASVDLKPFQLAPFFKNVIVDIKPLPNEKEFEKYYGMNVDKCLELEQKGLFKLRLSNNYIDYSILENNYLDPIFEKNPPVSNVVNYAHGLLINKNPDLINEMINLIGENEFSFGNYILNDTGIIDPYLISAFDIMAGHSYNLKNVQDYIYKEINAHNFTKLWACGYHEINELFKEMLHKGNGRLDWTFTYSNVYSNFLSNPILDSVNGTSIMHSRMKELAKDMSIQKLDSIFPDLKNPASDLEIDDSILSTDTLNVMNKTIGMNTLLDSNDLDDFDYQGAQEALQTLERIVNEQRLSEISDVTLELQNELAITGELVKNLQEGKEHKKDILSKVSFGIGGIGTLGSLLPGNPHGWLFNLASLSGLLLDSSIRFKKIDWILDKINRFSKENHIIYMYDNFDKLNLQNLTTINVNEKQLFSKFNDNLTKKYTYYEYLYSKIPSIKVLIDIYVQNIIAEGPIVISDNPKIADELNKINENIYFNSKLKVMLQHQFLYGISYIYGEFNRNELNIHVINPHYVRSNNSTNEGEYYIIQNGKKKICKNIMGLNRISIIEKNIPLLDAFYPDITKIEKRPNMIYDIIENNNTLVENISDFDKIISFFKESLKLSIEIENKIQETKLNYQLGLIYMIKSNFKEAIKYLYSARDIADHCLSNELNELTKNIIHNIQICEREIKNGTY